MLDAFDIQGEILAPGGRHLIVEQGVAVHVGEIGRDHVVLAERGQDSDHDDPRVHLTGLAVRIGEARPQLLRELIEYPAAEPVRNDIYFQVEHPQLGLEIPARDALEHFLIHHPRQTVGSREIQLYLQPHQVSGAVEPPLRQQSAQPLQALVELGAVRLPIGQVNGARHDLLPHRGVPPPVVGPPTGPLASRSIMPSGSDP